MSQPNVFLGDVTRLELQQALSEGILQAAIVPVGACEQHQDHLPMIFDTAGVTEIARRVALHFHPRILVTPTIPMSVSEHHMNQGGALTIRPEILLEYLYDVCHSLKRLGVPKVLVLNGHGGNKLINLEPVIPEGIQKLNELGITFVTYWETCPREFFETHLEADRSAGHAGEFETSLALMAFPEIVRPDKITYDRAQLATQSKGAQILSTVVACVTERVEEMLQES